MGGGRGCSGLWTSAPRGWGERGALDLQGWGLGVEGARGGGTQGFCPTWVPGTPGFSPTCGARDWGFSAGAHGVKSSPVIQLLFFSGKTSSLPIPLVSVNSSKAPASPHSGHVHAAASLPRHSIPYTLVLAAKAAYSYRFKGLEPADRAHRRPGNLPFSCSFPSG